MTVLLPEQLPAQTGWFLADYRDVAGSATADAGGVATLTLDQLPGEELWIIDHAVVACDSAADTEMRLYSDAVADWALLDGTSRGNFDVADWPAGLRVTPGTSLVARWTGATPGATATLRLQVRVLLRRP